MATRTSTSTSTPTPEQYLEDTLKASAISEEVASARGYQAVKPNQFTAIGKPEGIPKNFWGAGFWIPLTPPNSDYPAGQLRLIEPVTNKDGGTIKYVTATGKPSLLDTLHYKPEADTVYLIEGVKQADAVATAQPNLSIIAMQGCYGWVKDGGLRVEIIALCNDKDVRGLFDADFRTNPQVNDAAQKFLATGKSTKAIGTVKMLSFPAPKNNPTAGVDDWLASGGDWSQIQEHTSVPKIKGKTGQPADKKPLSSEVQDALNSAVLEDASMAQYLLDQTPMPQSLRVMPSQQVYRFDGQRRLWEPLTGTRPNGAVARCIDKYLPQRISDHFEPALAMATKKKDEEGIQAIREAIAEQTSALKKHRRRMAIAAEVFQDDRGILDSSPDSLTGQDHLLPIPGGKVWDLSKFAPDAPRNTYESDRLPEHGFTWELACTPADGPTPIFDQTMRRVLRNDKTEALLDAGGYSLQGSRRAERAFVGRGGGRNGKSLFWSEILGHRILGKDGGFIEAAPGYFFGYRDRHDHHLLAHLGKRLITITDPSGPMKATEFLSYTGGGGTVHAEKKGGETLSFRPTAFLAIVGQDDRMTIDGNDTALRERLWTILFPDIPEDERDRALISKLEPEVPALAWNMTCRAARYVQTGQLDNEALLIGETKAMAHEHNPIAQFAADTLVAEEGSSEIAAEVFKAWKAWAENNNADKQAARQNSAWFGRNLKKVMPSIESLSQRIDGKPQRILRGVRMTWRNAEDGDLYDGYDAADQDDNPYNDTAPTHTPEAAPEAAKPTNGHDLTAGERTAARLQANGDLPAHAYH